MDCMHYGDAMREMLCWIVPMKNHELSTHHKLNTLDVLIKPVASQRHCQV